MSALRLVIAALVSLATAAPVLAADRVALVIGNSAYMTLSPLAVPTNDAKDIAAALTRIGFEVDQKSDLDLAAMKTALDDLKPKAERAKIAVVYFAGHGVQVAGDQYLLPVDAKAANFEQLATEAVSLETVMKPLSDVAESAIVFVDASRDNPFLNAAGGASPKGFADPGAPRSFVVGFATSAGHKVIDDGKRNGPFARALLSQLEVPGLEIASLLRKVRDEVISETDGKQTPFFYATLSAEVYLVPPK